MLITAIIPTYNEGENLPKLVSALLALPLPELRILVVDDNSPDETGQVADSLVAAHPGRIEVLHRPCKMGTAYVSGFRRAIERGAHIFCRAAVWSIENDAKASTGGRCESLASALGPPQTDNG